MVCRSSVVVELDGAGVACEEEDKEVDAVDAVTVGLDRERDV